MQKITNKLFFIIAFLFSKGSVFLAPLFLSKIISVKNYGVIEYALSIGMILASILNFGITSAYPFYYLKRKYKTIYSGFDLHGLITSLFSFCLLIIGWNLDLNTKGLIAILLMYLLSNQQYHSSILKSKGAIISSTLMDSIIYFLLWILTLIYAFNLFSFLVTDTFLVILLIYYVIIFCYRLFIFIKADKHHILKKLYKIIGYGRHVLLSGFLIMFITMFGKISTEHLIDTESVGIYSFYLRIGSLVVVFHQFFNIAFFKKDLYYRDKENRSILFLFFIPVTFN